MITTLSPLSLCTGQSSLPSGTAVQASEMLPSMLGSACPIAAARAAPHLAVISATRARSTSIMAPAAAQVAHPVLKDGQYSDALADAVRATRLASRLCQRVQRELSTTERADKADDSPVTVADYAAQALVAWSLSRSPAAAPDGRLSMVAEEDSAALRDPSGKTMLARITQLVNEVIAEQHPGLPQLSTQDIIDLIDLGGSQGGPAGRHWVLDPIDGTRGFVGMRQYSVCLGMLQDGVVELGVLGCPNLPQGAVDDEDGGAAALDRATTGNSSSGLASAGSSASWGALFLGHRGRGAYMADLYGKEDLSDATRIRVVDPPQPSGARFMESYESRHSDHSFTAAVARELGVTQAPLRMDSQVKYGLLSRGEASIFMRFPPPTYKEKIWDHCAGFVIVEEAGGCVTDAGGKRLDFSQGRYLKLDRGIIAAPPGVHAQLLKAIAAVSAGREVASTPK